MKDALEKLKKFEDVLKKYIVRSYGNYIPDSKKNILDYTEYASSDLLNDRENDEIIGDLCRMMFDELIDTGSFKDFEVEEGVTIPLPYANTFEDAVIEYFVQDLAKTYNLTVDTDEELAEDLRYVNNIKDILKDEFFKTSFSQKPAVLLNKLNNLDLIKYYDNQAMKEYNLIPVTRKMKNSDDRMM